jgi:hypothetical protein
MPEFVLDPGKARGRLRRRLRSRDALAGLAIVTACVFFAWPAGGAVREVRQMGPWPPPDVEPAALLPPDLSALGLGAARIVDARGSNSLWTDGTYVDGAVAEYRVNGQAALWVASLRYGSSRAATYQFEGYMGWAEENCGLYLYGSLGSSGRIECRASDYYNKTYLHENWIVDVFATDAAPVPPRQLVDDARDALAQHWKTLR